MMQKRLLALSLVLLLTSCSLLQQSTTPSKENMVLFRDAINSCKVDLTYWKELDQGKSVFIDVEGAEYQDLRGTLKKPGATQSEVRCVLRKLGFQQYYVERMLLTGPEHEQYKWYDISWTNWNVINGQAIIIHEND